MFLLFDPRFTKLMQDELGYDDEVILEMRRGYTETVLKIQFGEVLTYITEKKLAEEEAKLDAISDTNVTQEQQLENVSKLYQFLNDMQQKYPELQQKIETKLRVMTQETAEEFFNSISEAGLVQISTWLVDDANNSKELSSKFPEIPRFPKGAK
jgi:hypothetical protein